MVKILIKNILIKIRIFKPVRAIFNFVFLFNAKVEINSNDVCVRFFTPTFKIREDVKKLFGEREILSVLLNKLRSDDIVWDVGASYGMYALFIGRKLSLIKVFAFEPESKAYKLLNKNIKINNINNVIPLKFALWDSDGTANLYTSSSANIGTHSLVYRKDYPVARIGKLIEVCMGDSIIQKKDACFPTVLKIDVEGAEYNVLKGMPRTLSNPKLRIVQIEIHPKILPLFDTTADFIYSLMDKKNFKLVYRQERGTEVETLFER
jgi:FkbM family methyltransferase